MYGLQISGEEREGTRQRKKEKNLVNKRITRYDKPVRDATRSTKYSSLQRAAIEPVPL